MAIPIAAIAGLAGAGASFLSSASANQANREGIAADRERVDRLQDEIDLGRANVDALLAERDVPSELFAELVRQYPGLLQSILPELTSLSIGTTDQLADAGTSQFLRLRERITPGASALSADRLDQINQLNPENLGAEEIAAINRMLSPLIPAGTVDPDTGAVAGATTSPVSLYRNLISSQYNDRRSQFLGEARSFVGDANNAAQRQQVSAADFLNARLGEAFTTSSGMALADVGQQQGDIDTQIALIQAAAAGLAPQFDTSANNRIAAAGVQGGISSLGRAVEALQGKNILGRRPVQTP